MRVYFKDMLLTVLSVVCFRDPHAGDGCCHVATGSAPDESLDLATHVTNPEKARVSQSRCLDCRTLWQCSRPLSFAALACRGPEGPRRTRGALCYNHEQFDPSNAATTHTRVMASPSSGALLKVLAFTQPSTYARRVAARATFAQCFERTPWSDTKQKVGPAVPQAFRQKILGTTCRRSRYPLRTPPGCVGSVLPAASEELNAPLWNEPELGSPALQGPGALA